MNTRPEAQESGLAELLALSERAAAGVWTFEQVGDNVHGVSVYRVNAYDDGIEALAEFFADDHSSKFVIALVNWFRTQDWTTTLPPSDAIAQAFREMCEETPESGLMSPEQAAVACWINKRAREIDASAPAAAVGGDLMADDIVSHDGKAFSPVEQEAFYTPAAPVGGFVVPPANKISAALHAAVEAIYFDDRADFLAGLWGVVKNLAPELVAEIENDPRAAYDKTDSGGYFSSPAAQSSAKDGARVEGS